MQNDHVALTKWLRAEFDAEQESGFSRLKRVPDTKVVRCLDRFAGLAPAERSELMAVLAEWSSYKFLGTPPPKPIVDRFINATAFPGGAGGIRYSGVNLLAGLVKERGHDELPGFFQNLGITGLALEPPDGLLRNNEDLVPAKIPSLRRMVNKSLGELFAQHITDMGSETWRYEGLLDGYRIRVDIRFSGRMGRPQLSYDAEVRGKGRAIIAPNLCFESILGVGFGQWDYITMENAERSVALLAELIQWLANLADRLPEGFCMAAE
jgi:hypothetical protein